MQPTVEIPFASVARESTEPFHQTAREDGAAPRRVSEAYPDGELVWQRAAAVNAARSRAPDASS